MNTRRVSKYAVPAAAVALSLLAAAATAQHRLIRGEALEWKPVPSLPAGAQITVIEGPMDKAAPFTVRIKFPAHYRLPAHTHPAVERVTVLSGTFHMGMGKKLDLKKTEPVRAGDIMILNPGTEHFAWTDTETVVQLHGTGPWGITYVNPADDPRKH